MCMLVHARGGILLSFCGALSSVVLSASNRAGDPSKGAPSTRVRFSPPPRDVGFILLVWLSSTRSERSLAVRLKKPMGGLRVEDVSTSKTSKTSDSSIEKTYRSRS